MPKQLRRFFAHLLLHTELSEPLALWERFRDDLSDDFYHDRQNRDAAVDLALQDLQKILEQAGRPERLGKYGLPEPMGYNDDSFRSKEMRRETLCYDASEETREADAMREKMYDQQASFLFPRGPLVLRQGGVMAVGPSETHWVPDGPEGARKGPQIPKDSQR